MTDTERLDWMERLCDTGCAPCIVNNDNGYWAVSFEGFQPIDTNEPPADPFQTTIFVDDPACWSKTIRGAIDKAREIHEKP
jgi:hypothetical protein